MSSASIYKNLIIEDREKLRIIKFNNLKKKNALNREAYREIIDALQNAAQDPSIVIVAFTGMGDIYSSGIDISASMQLDGDFDEALKIANALFMQLVKTIYDFPKILFAVVNGPCLGIAATTAALCDVIYCTEDSYFHTPFTSLGLCPEACSSYTFPQILGKSKASEMLLLNHKMYAQEALKFNFVSAIYKKHELDTIVWPKIMEYSRLPPGSMLVGKQLMKQTELLDKVNITEVKALNRRWHSDEAANAVQSFINRKSKL